MQTFLPYADFEASARVLDTPRLGKQRVEVIQCVRALTVPGYAWANHPAVMMWRGYEEALGRYGLTICAAWTGRGYADTCAASITADLQTFGIEVIRSQAELAAADALPGWLNEPEVPRSHRSALVRKDPERYAPVFPEVPDDIEYFWPVRSPKVLEAEARRAENARLREQRRLAKLALEAERARRQRSAAAKRGWATRTERLQAEQRRGG